MFTIVIEKTPTQRDLGGFIGDLIEQEVEDLHEARSFIRDHSPRAEIQSAGLWETFDMRARLMVYLDHKLIGVVQDKKPGS